MANTIDPQGYIKSWRKIMDNQFLMYDNTAYILFTKLLHLANRQTGAFVTGRYHLAERTNIKPTTAYKALMRLEENGMVTLASDRHKTTIYICNWATYQELGDTTSDTLVTPKGHLSDTSVTLNKNIIINNKELRTNTIVNAKAVDQEVQEIFNCYITEFKTPTAKLSDARKRTIKLRLKDAGRDMLIQAIKNTARSPHHTGDNERGWKANIDFIIKSYEQVERLSELSVTTVSFKKAW